MGGIKALLIGLLQRIKGWPLASLLRPFYKRALCWAVGRVLEEAKAKLREAASGGATGAIDRAVDGLQERLKAAVRASPLPSALEEAVAELIQAEGDKLQERIKAAVKAGGPAAVDAACDGAGQALLAAIAKL